MARHDRNAVNRGGGAGRRVRLPVTPLSERSSDGRRSEEENSRDRQQSRKGLFGLARGRRSDEPEYTAKVKWPKRTVDFRSRMSQSFDLGRETGPEGTEKARQTLQPDRNSRPAPSVPPAPEPEKKAAHKISSGETPLSRGHSGAEPEPPSAPKEKEPLLTRTLRVLFTLAILSLALLFYFSWMKQEQDSAVPPMVMPQPYFYEEEQPVRALLLWHEEVLKSPGAGTVQLTYGAQPAAVAANDVVATVLSRGKTQAVRAPARGYFIPAVDGAEENWDYSSLWLGTGLLPQAPQNTWVEDLAPLGPDRVVGKLVYLPQSPRAVFYLNLTDMLNEGLQRGTILIRRVSKGPKWSARVRVYVKLDEMRAKAAIDMPYFPMDMALSREANFLVCSDEDSGLIVPDTAVVLRNGTYGVFELVGDRLEFRKVTGKPVSGGRFFVSSGLQPGNPVILNAGDAEEKRVRLW